MSLDDKEDNFTLFVGIMYVVFLVGAGLALVSEKIPF